MHSNSNMNEGSNKKIRVLIVDDSPLMCKVMKSIISSDPELEVGGIAMSGQLALDALAKNPIDVCTLDVNMPGMNGITLLKHIMIKNPKPCLMVSAFTAEGSDITFTALKYGAVDFFQKPSPNEGEGIEEQKATLLDKIKRAARVKVTAAKYLRLQTAKKIEYSESEQKASKIIVISTSTGGYSSILSLIPLLTIPPKHPIIVVMGTPPMYLGAFVDYINSFSHIKVKRLLDGDIIKNEVIHFISSDETASIETVDDKLKINLIPRKKSFTLDGAIDMLLFNVTETFGENVMAVFLSGDGEDGLNGAKHIQMIGGTVLVQDPDTCLCYENPQFILKELGVNHFSIDKIAEKILNY